MTGTNAKRWESTSLRDLILEARPGFACGEVDPGGLVQFRMNNVTRDGTVDWTKMRRVPVDRANLAEDCVQEGDVLFNCTNSPDLVGKSTVFVGFSEPVTFSNHFLRLRTARDRLDPGFLNHWLRVKFSEGLFRLRCRQWVNQATMSRDDLLDLRLMLPPLAEQRRIAAILDRGDAVLLRRRSGIEKLRSVFASLFIEMFGDPSTGARWERVPLNELTMVSSGSTPSRTVDANFGRGTPWLKTTEVAGEVISSTEEEVTELGIGSARLTVFPTGSIIVALYGQGATRGRCALLGIDATVNQACGVIVPADSFEPLFLFWQLKMSYERLRSLGRGGNQPNLNLGLLGGFRVVVPPIQSQRAFVRAAIFLDEILQKQIRSNRSLGKLFASLQHRAFRGEL